MMKIDTLNFTIYDVEEIQTKLIAEVDSSAEIEIDMQSVEKVDIAALQLLVSAKKSCQADNKEFSLLHVSPEVVDAIKTCGLERELGV